MKQGTSPARAPLQIGLLWHSDRSGNLGVGALTVGDIAIISGVAAELGLDVRFVILGFENSCTPYVDDPRVRFVPMTTRGIGGFLGQLDGLDCVIDIGLGDSFADIYPLKRFAWLTLSKVAVIRRGIPLVLAPQTIGPFLGATAANRAMGRLARWAMRRATAVVVRDDKSRDAVIAAVPDVTPVYAIDVAFALPWTPAAKGATQRRIGLNVSGLLWNGGYTGKSEFNLGYDYQALTIGLIEALLTQPDTRVELICHVNGDGDVPSPDIDGAVADQLVKRYPQLVRVPDFVSPSQAKSYISGLDALVGARMHACIAAFSTGIPVVPVSYSRKFEGLFGSLGYRHMVPHDGMGTDAALAFILASLAQPETLRSDVAAGLKIADARLEAYRQTLRDLLSKAG